MTGSLTCAQLPPTIFCLVAARPNRSPCDGRTYRHTVLPPQPPLRALTIEGQCWFRLHDLAHLLAIPYPERWQRRLDGDQHREHWIESSGDWRKRLLVSESGAITLIVRSQIPEHCAVRQWPAQEVIRG